MIHSERDTKNTPVNLSSEFNHFTEAGQL